MADEVKPVPLFDSKDVNHDRSRFMKQLCLLRHTLLQ